MRALLGPLHSVICVHLLVTPGYREMDTNDTLLCYYAKTLVLNAFRSCGMYDQLQKSGLEWAISLSHFFV